MEASPDPSALDFSSRTRLQGYLAGRSTVLVILLVTAGLFQARQGGLPLPFTWFFAATAASFAFSLASILALRGREIRGWWEKAQPIWDVAYATTLVYLSGGAFSPFATLYPLAIIGGAILRHRRGALIVATTSAIAYGLLSGLQFHGFVTPLNPFPLPALSGTKLMLQLVFNLVAFYAIAVLSGYLAEELRRTGLRLEAAQAEVLDLEHLKESILHSLGSGLVALDADGKVLFHNEAAVGLLAGAGVTLDDGTDLAQVFDLDAVSRSEVSLRNDQVILGYSVSPLYDRDGRVRRGSLLIFQDLSNVKKLERDLRQADRLAAVGRLAAGLAHEIRNPLASLAGSVEMIRGTAGSDSESQALFEIILRETERLNRLVTNFLHYARPSRPERQLVDLRDLVTEIGFFFSQGEGKKNFHLTNHLPEGLQLRADRSQLEQLLLNLFRNSAEASPGGVTVVVEGRINGGSLELVIRDDGPGIAPHHAERIFEPFFTRKEGGTGLGLATVHRIVSNHGGAVRLRTAEGRGMEFHFDFPMG